MNVDAEIASIVQSVNEWDDRTSPDDYPEHLLITSEELTLILHNFFASILEILQRENEELRQGKDHIAAEKAGISKNAYSNIDYWKSQHETAEARVKSLEDALPLAAIEQRDVDEVNVTGWGVLEGHAIPIAVARKLATRINLCISSALSAQAQDVAGLDARMKAAGMYSVSEMMGVTPLTKWTSNPAINTAEAFSEWLDRKVSEYLRMKAAYALGDKSEDDDLYEWVLAHAGVFSTIRDQFRVVTAAPTAKAEGRANG